MFVIIALVLIPLAVLADCIVPTFLEPECDDPTPHLVTSLRPGKTCD
jgi:hypothetical protein